MDHIDALYYINLDHRRDRKKEFLKQAFRYFDKEFLFRMKRLPAVSHERGYVGCARSHVAILNEAIEKNYQHVLIMEDDFQFTMSPEEVETCLRDFFTSPYASSYKVCMLASNLYAYSEVKDASFLCRVHKARTASGYLIHRPFMETLRDCFQECAERLAMGEDVRHHYEKWSIDTVWWKYQIPQEGHGFYAFSPRLGLQRASYSDIEKRFVDYRK